MMSKKKKALLWIIALLCLPLCACASTESSEADQDAQPAEAWHTISAEEAKQLMSELEDGHVILDVRTEAEFIEEHVKGAFLVPYDEVAQLKGSELCEPDKTIFVYCQTGRRSAIAAETLSGLGFTKVYDFGGIEDWPYETGTGIEA